MAEVLFVDVEVEGRRVDVRHRDGVVVEVGPGLAHQGELKVAGEGAALLPGLHDHHLHLLAIAAERASVDCREGLDALVGLPGAGWIRGVNAQVSVDRHALDALVPDRPVRLQHRSGALWMLNTVGTAAVADRLDDVSGIERDAAGVPTGRLWRLDADLRAALPEGSAGSDLGLVVDDLLALGITSVTDATPDLDTDAVRLLSELRIGTTLLGDPDGVAPEKIVIHDHALPSYDVLLARVLNARERQRAVALHCVTRASLVLALAVLDDVGRRRGDRIEHGSVIPVPGDLAGLTVVTQPGFIADRGHTYRESVDQHDLPCLYRYRTLLDSGIDVLPSSDAPYGPLDPWTVMAAASERRAPTGQVLGADERVPVEEVLRGFTADAAGRPRRIRPRERTPVLLLDVPLAEAQVRPHRDRVRLVQL